MTATDQLRTWFGGLNEQDRLQVLEFLYGRALVKKGLFVGPDPSVVTSRGLFVGPAPAATAGVCGTCGRPF